jgi:hypothetical protein
MVTGRKGGLRQRAATHLADLREGDPVHPLVYDVHERGLESVHVLIHIELDFVL